MVCGFHRVGEYFLPLIGAATTNRADRPPDRVPVAIARRRRHGLNYAVGRRGTKVTSLLTLHRTNTRGGAIKRQLTFCNFCLLKSLVRVQIEVH